MFNKDRDSGVPAFRLRARPHAVTASFLGWTLDAFDFFVVVFLIDRLAAAFSRQQSSDHRFLCS